MKTTTTLQWPNGMRYGFDKDGNRICTGAMMGRGNTLPDNPNIPCKLRMVKSDWVDGDYDSGGSYWGRGNYNDFIYWAFDKVDDTQTEVFVRAGNRQEAKEAVREHLPLATFFN